MSDLGSELKNAVLSPNAKTLKAACWAGKHHLQMWATAKRWFGKLELCDSGAEDIFLFDHPSEETLPEFLYRNLAAAIARGSHIFQFNPLADNFVRRGQAWFDHPAQIQPEWVWTHIKDNLTRAESDAKFGV